MTHEHVGLYTKHGAQVPLQGVEVTGELLGGHARVRVRQRYRNDEKRPVEAVYVFPLPSDGTLSAFSMTCAGRRVEGVVKEREEAFRTYDNAITDGHGAALLDEERRNVFTAQVGNLLPGEETVVEVEFLQAVTAEEGSVRWMLPTLVAPRYIPGKPTGDRTAHGREEPTSQVPDADRITPPVGQVSYGLRMDLLVDLGREVTVESPSHAVTVTREEGSRVRVGFSRGEVSLDRDLVLNLRSPDSSAVFTPLVTHRKGGDGPGTFALTVVPDLLGMASAPPKQEVVFAVDVSGSMDGESLPQAQAALRLCLRHLREGDRFNIIAFESGFTTFQPQPVPFSQRTLEQADQWVAALRPLGGTELLAPMKAAVQAVPDGVVVLLTDGQVGNESEILQAVLADRKSARVYSFGIGTNVSDVLLRDMAKQTGGAVEFIHPGERIDDKVVAQFSRALAPRVSELEVRFDGVECSELAPAELPPLIDGVPWTLLGRYAAPGAGTVTLRGRSGREPFALTVRVDLPAVSDRPAVEKLWAAERIRSWEAAQLTGRRAESMKQRIIDLAVAHQIVTRYTSFVVVEERTGERRTSEQAETRVVPVNAPAGWAMFGAQKSEDMRNTSAGGRGQGMPYPAPGAVPAVPVGAPSRLRRGAAAPGAAAPPPPPAPAPSLGAPAYRSAPAPKESEAVERKRDRLEMREQSKASKKKGGFLSGIFGGAPAPEPMPADGFAEEERLMSPDDDAMLEGAPSVASDSHASAEDLLRRQLANGLWDGSGAGSEPVRQARATALALLTLLREGITSNHPLHGAQVKKAVEALLALASNLSGDAEVAELALGVAWLASAGPRTRGRIEQAAKPLTGLSGRLGNEVALREHVDTLAAR
ncbi:VIT domain-containing protein [Comamonas sp. JC664]|uniref:VIT domain-containing protein n=1 Tax=Comamonas sp. JC664 TaxID=2801917 RepID=UPI00174EBB79|nr:VIT domain-containing protein [Comamonas sp. JC664]MBL0695476.1 VWA domain-containing protein [Comamonas sp. JC664]GHG88214.1 inter-alpha-trypsin inhibitor domain-containing protein [Comamonas sp. KCTC 72670]